MVNTFERQVSYFPVGISTGTLMQKLLRFPFGSPGCLHQSHFRNNLQHSHVVGKTDSRCIWAQLKSPFPLHCLWFSKTRWMDWVSIAGTLLAAVEEVNHPRSPRSSLCCFFFLSFSFSQLTLPLLFGPFDSPYPGCLMLSAPRNGWIVDDLNVICSTLNDVHIKWCKNLIMVFT